MAENNENNLEEVPTETLARLYIKQGFLDKGIAIYRKLCLEHPDNVELKKTLEDLESRLAGKTGQTEGGKGDKDEEILKVLENWLAVIQDKQEGSKRREAVEKHILVIHGPNLNVLGKREKDVYGTATLDEINAELVAEGDKLGLTVETFQSNHEGAIVEKIHDAAQDCQGVIINPAAYTHTSVAIRDALLILDVPIIEVHLSNIYKREPFRHKSMTSDVVTAQIAGLGKLGYLLALQALNDLVN
ncbi:MAG: type II 3-dehydroquinate dehydratase [Deltaproteobacteria bacterium]|nr:type II 3-dehydroquinate dehydratase [Deltaproteobacteria bacterium]